MDPRSTHLAFIGMAGAGKSALARRIARELGRPCVDIDASVSQRQGGITIAEVFAAEGEARFREMEAEALAAALDTPAPTVIATGGGIVEREENRDRLAAGALVVWLSATDEVLSERLRASSVKRPLLEGDLEGNLRDLRRRRQGWYEELADLTVEVGAAELADTTDIVFRAIVSAWPELGPGGAEGVPDAHEAAS